MKQSLRARVGIATGQVVVGDLVAEGGTEAEAGVTSIEFVQFPLGGQVFCVCAASAFRVP